jgi:hypothetical protein
MTELRKVESIAMLGLPVICSRKEKNARREGGK